MIKADNIFIHTRIQGGKLKNCIITDNIFLRGRFFFREKIPEKKGTFIDEILSTGGNPDQHFIMDIIMDFC